MNSGQPMTTVSDSAAAEVRELLCERLRVSTERLRQIAKATGYPMELYRIIRGNDLALDEVYAGARQTEPSGPPDDAEAAEVEIPRAGRVPQFAAVACCDEEAGR